MGKGFCNGGPFVLDLANKNKMNASVDYIDESISLWHVRLRHENIASIERLKQPSLIPTFSHCVFDKCKICVEAKCPRSHVIQI